MTVEIFYEKFELFADAADAVAKMRQLTLALALQGKIVDQLAVDGSGIDLLEQIIGTELPTEKRRKTRRFDRAEDIEAPFVLPDNWTWTTLGTIAEWGSGSTPSRGNPEFYDGRLTWLKSGELNDNRALAGSHEKITDAALKSGSFRINQPGDVLFAMYGATVGKAAILAEVEVTNQAVCGCTPRPGILNDYLFYYLVSERQQFRNASEGGAQPNFSKDKILTYPFPLPPFAEQKRIVAKVDELMALCDRLEAQQNEREAKHAVLARAALARFAEAPTPANFGYLFHNAYTINPADLRKSILTMAVQGKLVNQNQTDEPVVELLRNAADKLPPEKKRRITVPLGDVENVPFDLPSSWKWAYFQDVAFIASNLVDPIGFSDAIHLAPDNIEKGTGILLPCRTVGEDKVKSGNHRFYSGQLVYSKIRPNLSKVVIVNFDGLCSADMYPIDSLCCTEVELSPPSRNRSVTPATV